MRERWKFTDSRYRAECCLDVDVERLFENVPGSILSADDLKPRVPRGRDEHRAMSVSPWHLDRLRARPKAEAVHLIAGKTSVPTPPT